MSPVTFGNTSKYIVMGYFYRSLNETKQRSKVFFSRAISCYLEGRKLNRYNNVVLQCLNEPRVHVKSL